MIWASVSGGADSTAMALLLQQHGVEFEISFADTGAEFPETFATLSALSRHLRKKLRVVSSSGGFFGGIESRGFFLPSAVQRWCTRELKVRPLERIRQPNDVSAVGITADEAHRMDGKGLLRPLVDAGITSAEAKDMCREAGLLNPLYAWRSSVSCFCCPFQRKRDWMGMMQHHPAFYRLAEEWEERSRSVSGHGWFRGRFLRDMRCADESQIKLFPEEPYAPCVICEI